MSFWNKQSSWNLKVNLCIFDLLLTVGWLLCCFWKTDLREVVLHLHSDPFTKNHKEDFTQMADKWVYLEIQGDSGSEFHVHSSLINKDKVNN